MLYALFVTLIAAGNITETRWKTYDRFEECWEAATIIVKHRDDMIARCELVENSQ